SRGHRVLFLERDRPWYSANRDAHRFPYCETELYSNLEELRVRFGERVRKADAVIIGSHMPEGRGICDWILNEATGIRAFYDIDTPVTLADLRAGICDSVRRDQIPQFDLVLSFTGGPTLQQLRSLFGARRALPLYCSVDAEEYRPQDLSPDIHLGY